MDQSFQQLVQLDDFADHPSTLETHGERYNTQTDI